MKGLKPVQIAEQATLIELLGSGLIRDFSLALDGGAHVGGWTRIMAGRFREVIAVEPSEAFADLRDNCAGLANVRLIQAALLDRPGRAECFAPKRRTMTARQIRPAAGGEVEAITVDCLRLSGCGLLKLDLEGCEFPALMGAARTIRRHRPFILVELAGLGDRLGHSDAAVRALLDGFGYHQVFERGVDIGFARK